MQQVEEAVRHQRLDRVVEALDRHFGEHAAPGPEHAQHRHLAVAGMRADVAQQGEHLRLVEMHAEAHQPEALVFQLLAGAIAGFHEYQLVALEHAGEALAIVLAHRDQDLGAWRRAAHGCYTAASGARGSKSRQEPSDQRPSARRTSRAPWRRRISMAFFSVPARSTFTAIMRPPCGSSGCSTDAAS